MQIVDRYVLKEFILSLIYCVTAFIALYIIVDLFNYIDEMMRSQVPLQMVLLYYGTFIPTIFVQTAPIAALLATVYTLSNLKRFNELTALRISGLSLWKIIKPLIYMTALLGICIFMVNDRVVPELAPISSQIKEEKIKEIDASEKKTVIEDVAVFGAGNRIIYARSYDMRKKELKDIIVHQNDANQNLVMKLSAQRGYWEDGKWIFENGTTYRLNEAGYIIGIPASFNRKTMDIKEKPNYFAQRGSLPEAMNYRQLKTYIDKFAAKTSSTRRGLLVDLYYKTSLPFISLSVLFVASPFAFMVQRGGIFAGFGVSLLVGLTFFTVQGMSLALGKAGILPPIVSAWFANALFLFAGIYLMNRCR